MSTTGAPVALIHGIYQTFGAHASRRSRQHAGRLAGGPALWTSVHSRRGHGAASSMLASARVTACPIDLKGQQWPGQLQRQDRCGGLVRTLSVVQCATCRSVMMVPHNAGLSATLPRASLARRTRCCDGDFPARGEATRGPAVMRAGVHTRVSRAPHISHTARAEVRRPHRRPGSSAICRDAAQPRQMAARHGGAPAVSSRGAARRVCAATARPVRRATLRRRLECQAASANRSLPEAADGEAAAQRHAAGGASTGYLRVRPRAESCARHAAPSMRQLAARRVRGTSRVREAPCLWQQPPSEGRRRTAALRSRRRSSARCGRSTCARTP